MSVIGYFANYVTAECMSVNHGAMGRREQPAAKADQERFDHCGSLRRLAAHIDYKGVGIRGSGL